jgi:hypothetical protein
VTEQTQPDRDQPRTASEIVSAAERLAEEIRGRAHADADAIRARAGGESEAARAATKERLQRLSELADGMLAGLGEMRAELDALSGSLAGDSPDAPEPPAAAVAEPSAVSVTEPPSAEPAPPEPGPATVDDAGARLIALNLALSDTPRDEAARQLRDQVPDPERLVDEVYASVKR